VSKGRRITELAFSETIYPTMGTSGAVLAYEWAERRLAGGLIGRIARLAGRARLWSVRNP
jgi:hypothetical protein